MRRGGISFDRTDKNAIYIRMLGDVKMRGRPDKVSNDQLDITEADRKVLDKLNLPETTPRPRSRFMSVSKARERRWRPWHNKLPLRARLPVDYFYTSPAQSLLNRLGRWDFDIFRLNVLTGGRTVYQVAYHLFHCYNFINIFHLDPIRLVQFLFLIEDNYHESNPYHNAVHASDVTQSMHCFLQEEQMSQNTSDLEKMAALVAALSHDLDHPGVNNTFLVVTANHLAALYQNSSVLENHHWRSAVGLVHETGVISHLPAEQRQKFIFLLKSLILATDITRQQEFLLKFSRYMESGELRDQRGEEHRLFLLQIALKCADISNPCRPWKISQRWSRRVCNEFFMQGDTERSLNVAVTPLCDRHGNTVANIQHGFFQYVVSPLFKAWDQFMKTPLSGEMLSHLANNRSQWESYIEQGKLVSELTDDEDDDLENENMTLKVDEDDVEEKKTCKNSDNDLSVLPTVYSNNSETDKDGTSFYPRRHSTDLCKQTHSDLYEENEKSAKVSLLNELKLRNDNCRDSIYGCSLEVDQCSGLRCLSPVCEDHCMYVNSPLRRYSVPYIRRDLSFYLGLRRDGEGNLENDIFSRRQSLPITAMYFHGSLKKSIFDKKHKNSQSRSLSMDILLVRPKISNFSPSLEASFAGGSLNPGEFIPLRNQTIMLQGGSLTRFTYNRSSGRHSSSENSQGVTSVQTIYPSDLNIPPYQNSQHPLVISNANKHNYCVNENNLNASGLASSWPKLTQRKTTNGFLHKQPASNKSNVNVSYQKQNLQKNVPATVILNIDQIDVLHNEQINSDLPFISDCSPDQSEEELSCNKISPGLSLKSDCS